MDFNKSMFMYLRMCVCVCLNTKYVYIKFNPKSSLNKYK